MRASPKYIDRLSHDQRFVFGSNLAGKHGKGAALQALIFGAWTGRGVGPMGQTYAIPTKDRNLKVLPLYSIEVHVANFIEYAKRSPELSFLVTEIGCGLAGYTPEQIAPMFKECEHMENVLLPERFIDVLQPITDKNKE